MQPVLDTVSTFMLIRTLQVWILSRLRSCLQMIDWEFARLGNPARDVGVVVSMLLAFHYFHMLQPENNDEHRRVAYDLQEACVKFSECHHYVLVHDMI